MALSNAELAVTQANADKQAGEAAAKSEAAVQTAREIAQKEVEEAKSEESRIFIESRKDRSCRNRQTRGYLTSKRHR